MLRALSSDLLFEKKSGFAVEQKSVDRLHLFGGTFVFSEQYLPSATQ